MKAGELKSAVAFVDPKGLVNTHKAHLGNKYAFLFNKELIRNAKTNAFPRPPKRIIEMDLDDKLEEEANTSASSNEFSPLVVPAGLSRTVISAAAEEQTASTKKLTEELLKWEELIGTTELASVDMLREVRKFTRFMIANSLSKKATFGLIARETIAMAAILMAAERFELDLDRVLSYITANFSNTRINKLAKVRELRAYSLLKPIVESYDTFPSSP